MDIDIQNRPGASIAVVDLQDGEQIRAEAGAMVSMSSNIEVRTDGPLSGRGGGLLKSLKRTVLSGETFFTNEYVARDGDGQVTFAPSLCGDMVVHELGPDHELLVQSASYVAAPDSVQIDTRWQGLGRGLLSGESMFFLRCTGAGPVVLNAFGGIQTMDLDGELVVDTGHLVAFTSGLGYEIGKAPPSWIRSFLSGEGLVLRVRGRGRLYLQSRNPSEYGAFIGRQLPPRES